MRIAQQMGIAMTPERRIYSTYQRTYENAIIILNSRRRQKRPTPEDAVSEATPSSTRESGLRGRSSLSGMEEWLRMLGHSSSDINKLNIVHVAGTKGKGSTCAFAESFLRTHGVRTGFPRKTGLYTSPHLKYPEERIRINFEPLSRDVFTKYFFEVYDTLRIKCPPKEFERSPRYLQLYALMAFHTFIREEVDAAIVETHHGGEYDATNFIQKPAVTVVTTLGMDHVQQLGPTIEDIAWHKAGIFKAGALALSSPQLQGPGRVLEERAGEKGVRLQTVQIHSEIPTGNVQLQPEVQRVNCSVALAAANGLLQQKSSIDHALLSTEDISKAVHHFHWPGRFELVDQGRHKWFMDSAHNELSMDKAVQWYAETSSMYQKHSTPVIRVLIFSQDSDQRESSEVLRSLINFLPTYGVQFQHVIFTTYVQSPDSTMNSQVLKYIPTDATKLSPPEQYLKIWQDIEPTATIHSRAYVTEAVELARSLCPKDGNLFTLVTGSQHLVGTALLLLEDGA